VSKYLIRWRGTHVFNPSNFGLVVAFLVLGSNVIEPLDFWWGPMDAYLAVAYLAIVGGGLLITRRLKLLALATAFWLALAAGTGLLAASGHCMTANWAFAPVCGFDFWRVIVTSPEVLIFLFFMITDPKTVPTGQVGRVVFGLAVAFASVLMMAPMTDEFGTKVGLLAGLVVVCALRPLIDRVVPEPKSAADSLAGFGRRLAGSAGRAAALAVGVLLVGATIVLAGSPARGVTVPNPEAFNRVPVVVDTSTLPQVTISQDVIDFDHNLAGPEMSAVLVTLAQNLDIESQALLRGDASLLDFVDHGDRLAEMQQLVAERNAGGDFEVRHYDFDTVDAKLLVPFGMQTGLSLGLHGRGTVTIETYDQSGQLVSTASEPFDDVFAVRRATGDRWLNVAVLPPS